MATDHGNKKPLPKTSTTSSSSTSTLRVPSSSRNVDRGWAWVVLVAAFVGFAILSGLFYTFGIYYLVFLDVFGESRSYTAWVGSLNAAFLQIGGPIGSIVIVKLGCRISIIVGGIFCSIGFIISSYATSILHLFITYGIIIATGYNLVYSGLVVALGQYFIQRHSLAVGLSMAGSGIGVLAIGPAIGRCVEEFGWRGSMLINAGMTLQYIVLGSLVFPLPVQQDVEVIRRNASYPALMGTSTEVLEKISTNKARIWNHDLMVDSKFWCLNLSGFFWIMGGLTVFVISKDFASSRGLENSYDLVLVGLGLGDLAGRLLGGFIASSRRVSTLFYYSLTMVACSVVILGHLVVNDIASFFAVSTLFGFSYGQQSVLLPIAPVTLYGTQLLAVIFGYLLFTAGIGTLIGPPLAGWIIDETGSFDGPFTFAAICNFQAAILMFITYVIDRHQRMKQAEKLKNHVTNGYAEVLLKPEVAGNCLPNGYHHTSSTPSLPLQADV